MAAASKRQEIAATVEEEIEEEFGPKLIGKLEVRFSNFLFFSNNLLKI